MIKNSQQVRHELDGITSTSWKKKNTKKPLQLKSDNGEILNVFPPKCGTRLAVSLHQFYSTYYQKFQSHNEASKMKNNGLQINK